MEIGGGMLDVCAKHLNANPQSIPKMIPRLIWKSIPRIKPVTCPKRELGLDSGALLACSKCKDILSHHRLMDESVSADMLFPSFVLVESAEITDTSKANVHRGAEEYPMRRSSPLRLPQRGMPNEDWQEMVVR